MEKIEILVEFLGETQNSYQKVKIGIIDRGVYTKLSFHGKYFNLKSIVYSYQINGLGV